MNNNVILKKESLDEITKKLFKEAILLSYKDGISSVAPLGFSGDEIVLHGTSQGGRVSLIQIRNHSGDSELLITDLHGNFLFYGKFHISLGADFVATEYYKIFQLVKHKINVCVGGRPDFAKVEVNEKGRISGAFLRMSNF